MKRDFLHTLLCVLFLLLGLAAPLHAEQTVTTTDDNTDLGDFPEILTNDIDSIISSHAGTSAPSYAVRGTFWIDNDSASQESYYYNDGTDNILVFPIDISGNGIGVITAAGFAPSATTATGNRLYLPASNTLGLAINGSGEVQLTGTALSPVSSDGNALGTSALMWSDLFLASGAVVNFNNGDMTLTHSTDTLTFAGGAVALGTNPTMTSPKITTSLLDSGGNELIVLTATGSAVNEITLANGATGNNATLTASGETNTGITITGKGTKGVAIGNALLEKVVTVTDGAGAVIDCSLGNVFTWTAAADRTAGTMTNCTAGQKIIIIFIASGGARTLTLPTATTGDFIYGSTITGLTQTASGKADVIGCVYNTVVANRCAVVGYSKGF